MSWLPKFLKGQGRYFMFKQMGACSQEVLAVAGLAAGFPQAKTCILLYNEPLHGAPQMLRVCSACTWLPEYLLLLFMLPTLVHVSVSGL